MCRRLLVLITDSGHDGWRHEAAVQAFGMYVCLALSRSPTAIRRRGVGSRGFFAEDERPAHCAAGAYDAASWRETSWA